MPLKIIKMVQKEKLLTLKKYFSNFNHIIMMFLLIQILIGEQPIPDYFKIY